MISDTHVPRAQFNRLYAEAMSQLAAVAAERDYERTQHETTKETLDQAWEELHASKQMHEQAREALAAANKLGAFEAGKTIGAAEVRKERNEAIENARASQQMHEDARRLLDLIIEQRDEFARQLGIEPEWTEQDA